MKKLSKEEITHISKLAYLKLTENESEKFGSQLTNILGYVEKLAEVDTVAVSPLSHAAGKKNVFREDELTASLSQKQALSNAPAKYKGYFKVKAIFEK